MTLGIITLSSTRNDQCGHTFLSLLTGRSINRFQATPMPAEVNEQVNFLACNNPTDLAFLKRNGQSFYDDDDDDDQIIYQSPPPSQQTINIYPAGVGNIYKNN